MKFKPNKYGTTDWTQNTGGGRKERNSKDTGTQYMKLSDPSNIVRIVTMPVTYFSHQYKEEKDPGFGIWVKCSYAGHQECPLCALEHKPTQRWYVGVIDRKTNTYRVLDFKKGIYDKISTRVKKYGDIRNYDVDITVDPTAAPANYYDVLKEDAAPLSAQDLALIKDLKEKEEALNRLATPPEPKWVRERLDSIREKKGLTPVDWSKASSTEAPVAANDSENPSEDEENFDFSPA